MPQVKVAKATKEDIEAMYIFLRACENVLEREKFSFNEPENRWKDWDDDDPDRKLVERIRKNLAVEEGIDEDDVDDRMLMFEFLKDKFAAASYSWNRVMLAADLLIDHACDPTEDHLAFYPGFEIFHVAPEQ